MGMLGVFVSLDLILFYFFWEIGLVPMFLLIGMMLPFCIATSLMVIATGCTIYDPAQFASGSTRLSPVAAAGACVASMSRPTWPQP